MTALVLTLKEGREKALLRGHPWVFSGALARVDGDPGSGDTVRVCGADGRFLAWAAYSPSSQIRARAWSFDEECAIDDAFFMARLQVAVDKRGSLAVRSNAMRLVHGEADGLPGLIVDRYDDVIVAQFLAAGVERHKLTLVAQLASLGNVVAVYERSDAEVRVLEGLPQSCGLLAGQLPSHAVVISEDGMQFEIDVVNGQKTGFYLDQRDNRNSFRAEAAGRVLNCFCYTGGFSVAALTGRATDVLSIDSSAGALELARANVARNGIEAQRAGWRCGDVFEVLRELRNTGRSFDSIVLDPPKLSPTQAHVERAARAYKDVNLLALKLLAPGGILYTFSCSGAVSLDLFEKIVAGAAVDARRDAVIVRRLGAALDHPVRLSFPEGAYLKGLVLRVDD